MVIFNSGKIPIVTGSSLHDCISFDEQFGNRNSHIYSHFEKVHFLHLFRTDQQSQDHKQPP